MDFHFEYFFLSNKPLLTMWMWSIRFLSVPFLSFSFLSFHFALFLFRSLSRLFYFISKTISWNRVHNLRDWIYWFIKRLPFISTFKMEWVNLVYLFYRAKIVQYRAKIAILPTIVLTAICFHLLLFCCLCCVGVIFHLLWANKKHMNHLQL